jgi:hypothetical protein
VHEIDLGPIARDKAGKPISRKVAANIDPNPSGTFSIATVKPEDDVAFRQVVRRNSLKP